MFNIENPYKTLCSKDTNYSPQQLCGLEVGFSDGVEACQKQHDEQMVIIKEEIDKVSDEVWDIRLNWADDVRSRCDIALDACQAILRLLEE